MRTEVARTYAGEGLVMELKPCPFCGGEMERTGLRDSDKLLDFGMRCKNTKCAAAISFPWWIVKQHENESDLFLNRRTDHEAD
jgi:hypothetical protein